MGILIDESEYMNLGRGDHFIIIPNEIINSNEFQNLYRDNQDITGTVKFPNLKSVDGFGGLYHTFEGCTGLTGSVEFPNLTKIDIHGLYSCFNGCTGLTGSVEFPNLTEMDIYGIAYAFTNCTGLTGTINFPSLITVGTNGLNNTFKGCTGITEIHFRADAKSVIEAQGTYDSKFGATNATIYFDL